MTTLITGSLNPRQTATLGLWRRVVVALGVVVVVVMVIVVVVVRVQQAGRAAVNGAPFTLVQTCAVRAVTPHASRKLGACHAGPG